MKQLHARAPLAALRFAVPPWLNRTGTRNVIAVAAAAAGLSVLAFTMSAHRQAATVETAAESRPHGGAPAAPSLPHLTFGVGDKIRLAFFERLDSEEDKWTSRRHPQPKTSFYLRQELSGDYTVQSDGNIALPLLGQVAVAGRDFAGLTSDLAEKLTVLVGRPGFVNLTVVERPPIYVMGPLKQPGVFKYEPGLTVLHAVALAGGLDRAQGWTAVEAARESVELQVAAKRLRSLLARTAVLHAERDRAAVKVPDRLIKLAGLREAEAQIAEESARRGAVVAARQEREKALASATQTARHVLEVSRGRLAPLQTNIAMRRERMARLSSLAGTVDRAVLAHAQSDLSDTEERRADVLGGIANAERALTLAQQEEEKFRADIRVELDGEIAAAEHDIDRATATLSAGSNVIGALSPGGAPGTRPSEGTLAFQLVRQTAAGPQIIAAEATTPLLPGDLIRALSPSEIPGTAADQRQEP